MLVLFLRFECQHLCHDLHVCQEPLHFFFFDVIAFVYVRSFKKLFDLRKAGPARITYAESERTAAPLGTWAVLK